MAGKCQSGRRNCREHALMGSRCIRHYVKRTRIEGFFYKKIEETFIACLQCRFELILLNNPVCTPEEFVRLLVTKRVSVQTAALMVKIVRAVDVRAKRASTSGDEEGGWGVSGHSPRGAKVPASEGGQVTEHPTPSSVGSDPDRGT